MRTRQHTYFQTRRGRQLIYLLGDLLASMAAWLCFMCFRWMLDGDERMLTLATGVAEALKLHKALIGYPLFCCLVFYLSGYYMQPNRRQIGRELISTLLSTAVITLAAFFYIIIDDVVPDHYAYYNSILALFGLEFGAVYMVRLLISLLTKAYGHKTRTHTIRLAEADGEVVLPEGTERVVIEVPDEADEKKLYDLIGRIYPKRVEIAFTARTYDLLMGRTSIKDFDEQPMISITDMPMTDFQLTIKRTFDIVVSLSSLVVLSPVLIAIGAAVKCTSEGPVLYGQERIGHYGRPFRIWKFRTMNDHAEADGPMLTQDEDPRITPIGRWLRRYRLDELPQLWNILKGDMSVVGPRPERAFFIEKIAAEAPYYCLIYKMRPGLTSWGPIRVGYTDTLEKMIQRLGYDIAYMENMSLRLDIKILFYTIGVILHGKGK